MTKKKHTWRTRRGEQFQFRLSAEELRMLRELSAISGMPCATVLRQFIRKAYRGAK